MNTQLTHITEVSGQYKFDSHSLQTKITENLWVKEGWPIVYILQNSTNKIAYVGESARAVNRINNHLSNPKKIDTFDEIRLITSDKFNKSATLDIESNLIQYISADGTYQLQNGNLGLANHNYGDYILYLQNSQFGSSIKTTILPNITKISKRIIQNINSKTFPISTLKISQNRIIPI